MKRFAIVLTVAATLTGCGKPVSTGAAPALGLGAQASGFSGGRPVVMVPGYLDASWYFTLIEKRTQALKRSTHMIALFPNISDITVAAKRLAAHVEKVKRETGADKVDIVAHSEGGLIARQFVKFEGGDADVGRFVSLAVPHHGTVLGYVGPGKGADQMQPKSAFLQALNDPDESHGDIAYTSIRGNLDEIILPHSSMIQEGAHNVEVKWVDHANILTDKDVWTEIAAGLSR